MVSGSLPPSLFAQLLASDQWDGKGERMEGGELSGQERNRVLKKKTRFRHHGNSIAVANRSLDCSAQPTNCRIDIESQKDVTGTIVGIRTETQ